MANATTIPQQRQPYLNQFEREDSGEILDVQYEREDEFPVERTMTPQQLREMIIDQKNSWKFILAPESMQKEARPDMSFEHGLATSAEKGSERLNDLIETTVSVESSSKTVVEQIVEQRIAEEISDESALENKFNSYTGVTDKKEDQPLRVDFNLLTPFAKEGADKVVKGIKKIFSGLFGFFKIMNETIKGDILGLGAKKEKQEKDPEKLKKQAKAKEQAANKRSFFAELKAIMRVPSKEQKQAQEQQQISIAEALGITNKSYSIMKDGVLSRYDQVNYEKAMSEGAKLQKKREQDMKKAGGKGFDSNLLKAGENMNHFSRNVG